MSKRKTPDDWAANDNELHKSEKSETLSHSFMNDSEMDQLMSGIDFDEAMETAGSSESQNSEKIESGNVVSLNNNIDTRFGFMFIR